VLCTTWVQPRHVAWSALLNVRHHICMQCMNLKIMCFDRRQLVHIMQASGCRISSDERRLHVDMFAADNVCHCGTMPLALCSPICGCVCTAYASVLHNLIKGRQPGHECRHIPSLAYAACAVDTAGRCYMSCMHCKGMIVHGCVRL
jgi:hypothetical protein